MKFCNVKEIQIVEFSVWISKTFVWKLETAQYFFLTIKDVTVIHNIYARITSVGVFIVNPLPSNYPYLIIEEAATLIGRLDTATVRNLWPWPSYVLTHDLTDLPSNFDHN